MIRIRMLYMSQPTLHRMIHSLPRNHSTLVILSQLVYPSSGKPHRRCTKSTMRWKHPIPQKIRALFDRENLTLTCIAEIEVPSLIPVYLAGSLQWIDISPHSRCKGSLILQRPPPSKIIFARNIRFHHFLPRAIYHQNCPLPSCQFLRPENDRAIRYGNIE